MTKSNEQTTTVRFKKPGDNAPATLLAEAEIAITDGLLAGLYVSGIRVWRKKDDANELFATFPAKPYDDGKGGSRYWEYLRASDGKGTTAKAVRTRIVEAYRSSEQDG